MYAHTDTLSVCVLECFIPSESETSQQHSSLFIFHFPLPLFRALRVHASFAPVAHIKSQASEIR